MITVQVFGLLRLQTGIKSLELEAGSVQEVLRALPGRGIPEKELAGSLILVNGKNATKRTKLTDGDTVVLMSPVAGG